MKNVTDEIRFKMETAAGLIFAKSATRAAARVAIRDMCTKVEGFIFAGDLISANEAVLAVLAIFDTKPEARA